MQAVFSQKLLTVRPSTKFHRLLSIVILWGTAALWPVALFAGEIEEYGPFKIQRYTEADGLVSAEAGDMYKDHYGFLWIGTFNGVSRFDGRSFENFGRQSGLTESNIDLLGEDVAGQLFVRSVSNIYRYTGSRVLPFLKYPSQNRFIIAACPADTGNVWVAYEGATGVHLFSATSEVTSIATASSVLQIVKGNGGEIYVLEMNGQLSLLKNRKLHPLSISKPLMPYQNEGIKIYTDPLGKIWSYAANHNHLYAHQNGAVSDSIAVPANTRWWQWAVGATGNVYLASDSGSVFQLIAGVWKEILTKAQVRGSIYALREEGDGTLWICASGGLLRVTRKQYQNVLATGPDYYFAAANNGGSILRRDSLLYKIPNAIAHYYELQSQTITHIYVTHSTEVWYCTEQAVYYLPYGKKLQLLKTTDTYEGNKAIFRFRRVLEDGTGGLWVSSYHGVFYKKGDSLRYYYYREGLTEGAIYTIALDNNGVFYAAGVHVYALVNGRFKNVSKILGLADEITRLTTDSSKSVWLCQGTDIVIKIGQRSNGEFYRAGSVTLLLNGLPFAAASICFDTQNSLWICDNRALYCYRSNRGTYNTPPVIWDEDLSGSPLLYADDRYRLQVLSHPLSGAYLRTYAVDDLWQQYKPSTPQVQLTAIALFKQAFNWTENGFTTNGLGVPQSLRLQHNQNFITFYFTGITSHFSRSMAYRYRLNGYEKAWSPVTAEGWAHYTGLPAGHFVFEVQARSAGGAWSASMAYEFQVDVVWYLRWWAKALWATLLVCFIGLLMYYRGRAMDRKAQLRQLLAEEQLKALRAQINPHFLQNIFAFLAHELYTAQNNRAVKAIDRLSAYLRDVLRYSDKASMTLEEELEFAEEYLQMQQQLLSVPFRYTIIIAEDVDVFDVQVPSMLLQPLLENALKYGMKDSGHNHIAISISKEEQFIKCLISDTGARAGAITKPLSANGSNQGIRLTVDRLNLFFRTKKYKPQFYRRGNADGGCNVTVLLPVE